MSNRQACCMQLSPGCAPQIDLISKKLEGRDVLITARRIRFQFMGKVGVQALVVYQRGQGVMVTKHLFRIMVETS